MSGAPVFTPQVLVFTVSAQGISLDCLVLIAKGASITLLGPMKLQQSERQCLVDYHPQNTAQTDD